MSKRGMLSQPFVMIFALVVGSLILVWGLMQVGKLISFGSEVQMLDAVSSIREDIESFYYLDVGSSNVVTTAFPKKVTHICFYDHDANWRPSPNAPRINRAIIQYRENENVFIMPLDAYETTTFKIANAKPVTFNPLCIKNGAKFKLTTRPKFVEVS